MSLSSANNRFDSVGIKRKGARWVGKSVLAVVLILAILLNAFSFDPGFGSSVKNGAGQLGFTNNDDLEIKSPDTFSVAETPTFTIKTPEPRATTWFRKIFFPQEAMAASSRMSASLIDNSKKEITDLKPKIEYIEGDYNVSLPETSTLNLKPGKYTLKASWKDTKGMLHESSQDFNWGVLAINPNKSIYTPGEEARLGFGVLDDGGGTICDAKLILEITDPAGIKTELSDTNGQIKPSGKCKATSVTNIADYLAYFKTDKIGKYQLHLIAQTSNGSKSLEDSFDVKDIKDIPFEIERTSYPTRIYPPAIYPVRLQVKANQDFKGEVKDTLPGVLEAKCINVSFSCQVKEDNGKKKVSWKVDLKKGDILEFSYMIKFPRKSPELYSVGPIQLVDASLGQVLFQEARSWQIASDVVATKFMEAGGDATDDTKFYSATSGTITQDQSVKKTGRGSLKFDSTGSNVTAWVRKDDIVAGAGGRISAYFYYASAMGGNTGIMALWDPVASDESVVVEISSGGVLRLVNGNGTQLGSTGSTLSTGTWYRLDLSYTMTSTSSYELRLFKDGGTADISVSSGTALTTVAPTQLLLGLWYGSGASKTLNLDDVYVDDSTALTDTGDIRVTAKLPNAENVNQFDTAIGAARGSTDYNNVNERPLSETNGWKQAQAAAPTFGVTSDNSSSTSTSTDRKTVSSASPSFNGQVVSLVARLWLSSTASGTTVGKGVIYSDSSGAPGTLLATSDEVAITSTSEVATTFLFSGANVISVTAGTTYWIGVHVKDPGTRSWFISGAGTANLQQYNADTYSDGPATTFGTPTAAVGAVDVYVNYARTDAVTENYGIQNVSTGDVDISGNTLVARSAWVWAKQGSGSVGYWKFDECAGTVANDVSGAAHNGTIYPVTQGQTSVGDCATNANTMWYNGATGKKNASLHFDGLDDYVNVGDPADGSLDFTTGFTLSAWVKTTSGVGLVVMGKDDNTAGRSYAMFITSRKQGCSWNGVSTLETSTFDVTTGVWRHLVCTYNYITNGTSQVRIYRDGVLDVYSNTATGPPSDVNALFQIGARTYVTAENWFDGQIDDVRVYNRPLSAAEVSNLYTLAGAGPKMFNNGTEVEINLTSASTLSTNIVDSTSYPTDAAAVGMKTSDHTVDTYFYEGGMLIAFVGDPVPEAALIAGPLALFAPKIIKSIRNHTLKTDMADLVKKIFVALKRIMYKITGWKRFVRGKQGKIGVKGRKRRRRKFNDDS